MRDLKLIHSAIKKILSQLDSMVAPVWGRVVRGDTIESVADKTEYVLAGTLLSFGLAIVVGMLTYYRMLWWFEL